MKKNIELKNMIIISNEFYKISRVSECSMDNIDNVELIPIVVNCTFSIELALKCLYYANKDSKAKTSHNIKKIYDKTKEFGLEYYLLNFFSEKEIKLIINELENAFDDFRYLYEQEKEISITPVNMKKFSKCINEYCKDYLEKNWNIFIDGA